MRFPTGEIHEKSTYIAGVDIARTGADETAIVILERLHNTDNIFVCYMETLNTPDLNDAVGRVMYLDSLFGFTKVIVDETGLGAGVGDVLSRHMGGRVEGVWYTQKIKAEMFTNLKLLMNKKKKRLIIPDFSTSTNPIVRKMFYQFLSIKFEFSNNDSTRTPKISHEQREHDDIINAMALAASYFDVAGKRNVGYGLGGFNTTS